MNQAMLALAQAPRAEVLALAQNIRSSTTVRHLTIPGESLWMLTMEDGVFQDQFYLGEMPAASAAVELGDGSQAGAILLGDDVEQSEAIAICLAALKGARPETPAIEQLIQKGLSDLASIRSTRDAMRSGSRVAFAELGEQA
jgi:phosphonate C-P lyase system protein PhnG